ncbi:MAG: hypothetical protein PHP42_05420 [Bacteroidota bacterium]|nr:hypothetical protein [Bacteroidota bacterium]
MKRIVFNIILIFLFALPLSAQFYYFGHNKVQYTDFDWQILRTEHFDVYYYPEMKDLAEQGAFFAEEAYKQLESKFNHSLNNRVPLIFYSSHLHFEQTNTTPGFIPDGIGGFFEFLKGRVVIPADGSLPRFRHVIRHELVHVFMHSKIGRVLVDHRLPQDRMPPLWFTEGLAEAWSTEADDQSEMLIRDAVLNNYIVPLQNMEQIYGSFLMYKEGQYILRYIEQKYGDDKLMLLMENFWRNSSFSEIMKATIGKNYQELDDDWLYAFKKKYYPVLAQSDYTSQVSTTLVKKGFNSKPVFYKNGDLREVYYIANYTGYTSIYKVNLDGKTEDDLEPKLVIEGEKSDEFEAFHLFQSRMDISKDGVLAFVTKKGESDALHLFDVKEEKIIRTLQFENLVALESPNWSADGKKIVFAANDKAGKMDLYTYDLGREELKRMTNDSYDDRDPVWMPDQKGIIFSSDRTSFGMGPIYNLFKVDIASDTVSAVTYGNENFYSPLFSPDGKYLTFTSNRDGAQNIWTIATKDFSSDAPSYSMKKITHFTNAAFDPCWSDKDEILFSGFENYSFKIYQLSNVSATIDSTTTTAQCAPPAVLSRWKPQSVAGDTSVKFFQYQGDYSLDIAQSQVSTDPVFGTYGGAAMAISDLLGNDQYYFLLYNNAQSSDEFLESFNLAVTRISLGQRMNYATGIFHFAGRRYDLTDPDLYYYERAFGGYFVLSYPLSKFERIEGTTSLSNSDKDLLYGLRPRKALIFSNSISFIHDNSLWLQTGPIDGSRFLVTAAYTTDVQYGNVGYYTFIGDYRIYNRLSTRTALASRFTLMFNEGKEARRFFMGGSWDLRGWPRWGIRGKKLWIMSHELRFPFVDQLAVRFPFGGMGLGSFRGAVFFDSGAAWDDTYQETIGSIGAGLRWTLFNVLVFRYDVGKRIINDFNGVQTGLFYQFFFGWDF